MLVGIDLHTGNLVSINYTFNYTLRQFNRGFDHWNISAQNQVIRGFAAVDSIRNIKVYQEDENVGFLFDRDCWYNTHRRG